MNLLRIYVYGPINIMSGIILGESDHSDSDEWERLGNYFEIIRKLLDRIERKMP